MVEFKIKIHQEQKLAYMPKWLTDNLGYELKAIPDSVAVLMFSKSATLEDVLGSLEVIKTELKHAKNLKEKGAVKNAILRGEKRHER
jgi:hypothetical protein